MEIEGYISNLYLIKNREPKIGERLKEILFLFLDNKELSAYGCYKKINEQNKISYKNIHEHIKKLESFKMIESLSKNNFHSHGKIDYILSSFGLFFIIKNYPYLSAEKELFLYHQDDDLFKYFLYDYIQFSTLQNIDDQEIFREISRYLSECCKEIEKFLSWLSTLDKGENPNREILVSEMINSQYLDFQIDSENKNLNLIKDNIILATLPIVKHEQVNQKRSKISINFENLTWESFINQTNKIILHNSRIYLFNLCLNIIRYNYEKSNPNFKILFHDSHFLKYINQVEKDIDKYFISFKKLTKNKLDLNI